MNARRIAGLGIIAATMLLPVAAGVANAADHSHNDGNGDRYGYPSTQSPTQSVDSGQATAHNARNGLEDATDVVGGRKRPEGADGTEPRFSGPDPRFVEGPVGGLIKSGPFD